MDNLFEYLIPIVFIVGSLFLNRKKKEEDVDGDESEAPKMEPTSVEDIREEIRRRIREAQSPVLRQPEVHAEVSEPQEDAATRQSPVLSHSDRQAKQSYQRLERMREQVEELRAKADREKQKAASVRRKDVWARKQDFPSVSKRRNRRSVVKEVIRELHHPESARKAVLNAEILGTPVGLRKNGNIQPSWQQ